MIAKNPETSETIKKELEISNKEFYTRSSRLQRLGLIKWENQNSILTSLGQLVHQTQLKSRMRLDHLGN